MALCLIDSSIDVNPRFQKGKSPTPCADLSSVFSFAALPTHKDSRSICCMLPEVSSLQSMLSGSSRSPASLPPWNQPSRTPVASLDSLQNPITFCPRLCLFPRPTPCQPRDPPLLQHAPLSDGLHSRPLPPVCTSSLHLTHTVPHIPPGTHKNPRQPVSKTHHGQWRRRPQNRVLGNDATPSAHEEEAYKCI